MRTLRIITLYFVVAFSPNSNATYTDAHEISVAGLSLGDYVDTDICRKTNRTSFDIYRCKDSTHVHADRDGRIVYITTSWDSKELAYEDFLSMVTKKYGVPSEHGIGQEEWTRLRFTEYEACYGKTCSMSSDGDIDKGKGTTYTISYSADYVIATGERRDTKLTFTITSRYIYDDGRKIGKSSSNNSSRGTQPDSYNPKVIGRDSDGAIRVGCSGDATRNLILVYENNGIYTGPEWVSSTSLNETVREACKKRYGL